jgi:hypothetical protein
MYKKGQAAMEFLMTYGWAILVVLAAIAALAYFGVLSPDRFLPEKCTMPSGIACLDFSQEGADGVTLSLQNAAGFDMTNISVGVTGCTADTTPAALPNGQKDVYTATGCTLGAVGQKFKGVVTMEYTNAGTGLPHTAQGEVIFKVAAP